jgi:hypothetical protein
VGEKRQPKALVADAAELLIWAQGKVGGMLGETSPGRRHDKEPSPRGEGLDHNARHRYRDMARIKPDELRPEALDQLKAGYARLRAQGVQGPVTQQQAMTAGERVEAAAEATTGEVLPAHRPAEESRKIAGLSQPARAEAAGISERTQRKLDRLARERPDLLAEVKAGRLSAHAAAVEAEIVKRRTPPALSAIL